MSTQLIIFIALLTFLLGIGIFVAAYTLENFWRTVIAQHAPFVPIPQKVVSPIVDALRIRDGSVVYDLGCGDARVLAESYTRHPRAQYKGLEVATLPLILSWLKLKSIKKPHTISVRRKDFFKENLSDATHIFVYLFPHVMDNLLPKFQKECKPGTRIVSCDFQFKDKVPIETIDLHRSPRVLGKYIYVYEI